MVNRMLLLLVAAIGAVLIGLPYILGVFGPTEAEVQTWGLVSVMLGITLIFLSLTMGRLEQGLPKFMLGLGYICLALLQVPPILLWFMFHGFGISDGTPPSAFVAHWGYAFPHITLFIVSIIVIYVNAHRARWYVG